VIQTTGDHNQVPGDRIKLSGIVASSLNGFWWVQGVPTADTMNIAAAVNSSPLIGDGTGGGGGTVTLGGIFQASVFTGDLATKLNTGTQTQIQCQGISKTSWSSPRTTGGNHGIMLPVINIGTESADGVNSSGKPILQAPYVSLRISDDVEARIAGFFWDCHVRLQGADFAQQAVYPKAGGGNSYFIAWGNDMRYGKIVAASYWFQIQNAFY
jgi:hypothetical protein